MEFDHLDLTADGPFGSHASSLVVHAQHRWPKTVENGWSKDGVDEQTWARKGLLDIRTSQEKDGAFSLTLAPDRQGDRQRPHYNHRRGVDLRHVR